MVVGVQLLEPFPRDMRVNLRRGNIGVPQEELHHAQIGTVIEKMRGKGMAKGMWR